ncbi:MAG TPA: papain-like cysteine protease family protein [Candidatus Tumulicola sp.]|jgi:hypothetical protein
MTTIVNLNVPYHQQDTSYYCGAASAQMLLDKIGASLIDQVTLYTLTHGNPLVAGWYTHPNGLRTCMNQEKPAAFTSTFAVDAQADVAFAMARIFGALSEGQSPVAALVQDGNHWVVVQGVQTSVPANASDPSNIIGVWVNDPWPPVPAGPIPPHADPDSCTQNGQPNLYLAWSAWNSDKYFNATDIGSGAALFVSVLVPPSGGGGKPPVPPISARSFMDVEPEGPISPDDAIAATQRGLVANGLVPELESLNANFVTRPGINSKAVFLVERLDTDAKYFLVLLRHSQRGALLSMVDQKGGSFGGTRFISNDEAERILSVESLQKKLRSRREIKVPGRGLVQTANATVRDTLVWKLCVESRSPFFPFYCIRAGEMTFFSSLDGTLYSDLHAKEFRG